MVPFRSRRSSCLQGQFIIRSDPFLPLGTRSTREAKLHGCPFLPRQTMPVFRTDAATIAETHGVPEVLYARCNCCLHLAWKIQHVHRTTSLEQKGFHSAAGVILFKVFLHSESPVTHTSGLNKPFFILFSRFVHPFLFIVSQLKSDHYRRIPYSGLLLFRTGRPGS